MNILVVSVLYPEPEYLNIPKDTKAVHYFAAKWVQSGHKVTVLHPHINPISRILCRLKSKYKNKIVQTQTDGVSVFFGQEQLIRPHTSILSVGKQKRLAKRFVRHFSQNGIDLQADLVAVHFPVAVLHFMEYFAQPQKTVAVLHGSDVDMLANMSDTQRQTAIAKLNQTCKTIAFRSQILKERALAMGLGTEDSPVLYSGIDDCLIADKKAIEEKMASPASQTLKILYAGRLLQQKCIDQVLKALAMIKDEVCFEFKVLGDGSARAELEALTEQLGLSKQVHFLGNCPREQVLKHMYASDVFAMVSINETFGLVYLEAMAQGCIAIGTKNEGIDGVIKDGENGFLIEAFDTKTLAERICQIAQMTQAQRAQMIERSYASVKDMSDTNMSKQYLTLVCNCDTERRKER